jgi:hypothetical protein
MNKKLLRHLFAFSLLLLVNFSLYQFAHAGILKTVQDGGLNTIGQTAFDTNVAPVDIRVTIAKIISQLLGLLGIIFLCLILYAGYMWMTAGGDTKKIDNAKDYIKNGTIGLLIVLSSWILTNFIMSCVVVTDINLRNDKEIEITQKFSSTSLFDLNCGRGFDYRSNTYSRANEIRSNLFN